MLEILNGSPIESKGTVIAFERNPDVFALADLKYDSPSYTGFFRKDELMGFGLMGFYRGMVNGSAETVYHGTHMHLKPEGRQKGFYYRASRFLFKESMRDARIGYALVMEGNTRAESFIARRHDRYPDVPYTKIINKTDARNIVVLFRKKESAAYKVRKADDSDIDNIVKLLGNDFSRRLFAPDITRDEFVRNLLRRPDFGIGNYYVAELQDKIVGVCAAWDCSSFKQLRVVRYGGRLKMVKRAFDILSFLRLTPPLPEENKLFKEVYITEFATEEKNPRIMRALLTRIYNEYRAKKYNLIIFGSCQNDPLMNAVRGFINFSVRSNIVMSSNDAELLSDGVIDTSLPYIDFALL